MVEPSKMTAKIKLHLLAHLKADILRFGPLLGVATESFECFNAIFRYCSIYSNHLTPSRDIAFQLASQEGLKHRLTGGWWNLRTGNGNNQDIPFAISFMPVRHCKLWWVGPPQSHSLMVGPRSYSFISSLMGNRLLHPRTA